MSRLNCKQVLLRWLISFFVLKTLAHFSNYGQSALTSRDYFYFYNHQVLLSTRVSKSS